MDAKQALELSNRVQNSKQPTATDQFLMDRIENCCLHGLTRIDIKYDDLRKYACIEYLTNSAAKLMHLGYKIFLGLDRIIIEWKDDKDDKTTTN